MKNIEVNVKDTACAVTGEQINALGNEAASAMKKLADGSGAGSDFLGWVSLPSEITDAHLADIEAAAKNLRDNCDYVVAIGIGGSYLGAKAVIEGLGDSFAQLRPEGDPRRTRVIFAGQNIGEDYLNELQDLLKDRKFGIIVISKSGTTTEPAIAFRLLKEQLERQLGKAEASKRIVAVTDAARGALRQLATEEGYKTFVIPDNVGGRFSVLTPVGLLPIAVAGYDIRALVEGARRMEAATAEGVEGNPAALYAMTRNALYRAGKKIEILVNFNPKLHFFAEWWKQIYGE
ncbi:MAG: glucose-6-phosphate isomerase, partial [Muribaculaceae bacterium]|nr:glucose-6-phosphate isomerase [Muribaculaceae bacterium]